MIRLFIGFDPREAAVFHVCVNSIIRNTRRPVAITPLTGQQRDGSNAFTYARFLVPHLCGFQGRAIYLDGDMLVRADVAELLELAPLDVDVAVVKHDYVTKAQTKYLGNSNRDYPRKNWSSVIVWNCANWPNRVLTPQFIEQHDGAYLHRFGWLDDARIGALPREWNWLVGEYGRNDQAKLLHYTLGAPCFPEYADCDHAVEWANEMRAVLAPM